MLTYLYGLLKRLCPVDAREYSLAKLESPACTARFWRRRNARGDLQPLASVTRRSLRISRAAEQGLSPRLCHQESTARGQTLVTVGNCRTNRNSRFSRVLRRRRDSLMNE